MLKIGEFCGAGPDRSSRNSLTSPTEFRTIEIRTDGEALSVPAEIDHMRSIDRAVASEQAERCFRLAESVTDREVANRLRELGRQYEEAGHRPREDEARAPVRTSE